MNKPFRNSKDFYTAAALLLSVVAQAAPVSVEWQKKVTELVWVAYSPTNADPDKGIEPTRESMEADLALLRKAGFDGLVTYASAGIVGRDISSIAQAAGFRGLIMGIWKPANADEIALAQAAAKSPIVLGYSVGNEGLNESYNLKELASSMQPLRATTGKPVTTTEQIEDYENKELLQLGDWVFPNVHPYFNKQLDPRDAVRWTTDAYTKLKRKSDRFVLFKEVGLPTAGAAGENLSEANQEKYYSALSRTTVRFVYFEAFDLPWKTHLPVEPHWGIFRADRTPKAIATRLLGTPRHASGMSLPLPSAR